MIQTPKQSQCDSFYGNPRGRGGLASRQWEVANLTFVAVPWVMDFAGRKVQRILFHRKLAAELQDTLQMIWRNAGRDQKIINLWGLDVYSGSYNYRVKRGFASLSMHAYGCAVDFDAPRNGLRDRTPHFAELKEQVVKPFLIHGAVWGGDWNGNGSSMDEPRCDGMHFQWARLG
jgi:D-alanyl-D-alanine carboxypeptidase